MPPQLGQTLRREHTERTPDGIKGTRRDAEAPKDSVIKHAAPKGREQEQVTPSLSKNGNRGLEGAGRSHAFGDVVPLSELQHGWREGRRERVDAGLPSPPIS